MCNACGLVIAETAANEDKLAGVQVSEAAEAALAAGAAGPPGERFDLLRVAHPYKPEKEEPC